MQVGGSAFRRVFINVYHRRVKDQMNLFTHMRAHTHTNTPACLRRSYLSRYFSEKSTMVGNMGAGGCAGSLRAGRNLTACKHVSGWLSLAVQGFV